MQQKGDLHVSDFKLEFKKNSKTKVLTYIIIPSKIIIKIQ